MKTLINILNKIFFRPRPIVYHIQPERRIVAMELFVKEMLNTNELLKVRAEAMETMTLKTYKQNIGTIFGAPVEVTVYLDFRNDNI